MVTDCNCGGTRRAHGSCCWTSWQEKRANVWYARSWVCKLLSLLLFLLSYTFTRKLYLYGIGNIACVVYLMENPWIHLTQPTSYNFFQVEFLCQSRRDAIWFYNASLLFFVIKTLFPLNHEISQVQTIIFPSLLVLWWFCMFCGSAFYIDIDLPVSFFLLGFTCIIIL